MEKFFKSFATVAAMTLAAVLTQAQAATDDIVFTSDIPSRAVVSEIRSIGYLFPGFYHAYVEHTLCEVSFGDRKLSIFDGDYSLDLFDGGLASFGVSFRSPLKADVPTELTILLNPECLWLTKDWESDEVVSNDIPIRLTYTVAPEATNDVALTLASVTTPNDQGELGLNVVKQSYHRFYLKTEAPDILAVETEVPNVTLSGPEGYHAEATLNQAYVITTENVSVSYFCFLVEQIPTALGDYSITVAANAVADELHLRNPEVGRANPETVINFKMVERTVGVEQVTAGDSGASGATYTLGGVRVPPGEKRAGMTVSQDGTKSIR